MKITVDVNKIDNSELEKYIIDNKDTSQFDELEKIKPLIDALISGLGLEDLINLNSDFLISFLSEISSNDIEDIKNYKYEKVLNNVIRNLS